MMQEDKSVSNVHESLSHESLSHQSASHESLSHESVSHESLSATCMMQFQGSKDKAARSRCIKASEC